MRSCCVGELLVGELQEVQEEEEEEEKEWEWEWEGEDRSNSL